LNYLGFFFFLVVDERVKLGFTSPRFLQEFANPPAVELL